MEVFDPGNRPFSDYRDRMRSFIKIRDPRIFRNARTGADHARRKTRPVDLDRLPFEGGRLRIRDHMVGPVPGRQVMRIEKSP